MDPAYQAAAPAIPAMDRQERLIFTIYVVMAMLGVLFLATTGLVWLLGA
jgi:hypothetical protein